MRFMRPSRASSRSALRVFAASAFVLLGSALDVPAAKAQALNVDFGDPDSAPSVAYGAAGLPGAWNPIGVLPPGVRAALVGLDGQPVSARIYGVGGVAMLSHDDLATDGEDAALLDDMLIGYNNPLDVCLWIEALVEGDYEVLTYALTPGTASLLSQVRVDDATPGPIMVGGAFGGVHVEGVTYARHLVHTLNGKIGLHSGLYGGLVQSGINGLQIRPVSPTGVGDPGSGTDTGPRQAGVRSAQPNPARGLQRLEIVAGTGAPGAGAGEWLEVLDARGRLVFRHALAGAAQGSSAGPTPGTLRIEWDGRDLAGRAVPAGLYFARVAAPGGQARAKASLKLVRLH